MFWSELIIFFLSLFCCVFLVSIVGIHLFSKLFYRYKILDNPQKYGKKRKPIPYSMGVIFFIVYFFSSLIFVNFSYKLVLLWIFGALITIVSFLDDRISLSPKIRLFIQMGIATVISIFTIKIGYISHIFWWTINLEVFSFFLFGKEIFLIPVLFTIFWYVFIFNALNWTDGIGGNTSGLSFICFFVIFLLGVKLYLGDTYEWGKENALFIMQNSLILCAILLPFFYFDVHEKFLMGDSGTMFLGFMLASLAIVSGGKIATVLAVFGIYAVDALYVIFRRILHKKNPLSGDFTHLHHRLWDIGMSRNQILIIVFSLSFFCGITALFLDRVGKIFVFLLIAFVVIFLSYIWEKVKKISFKK